MSQFNQQFIALIIDRYGLEPDDERIDNIVATWIGQYDRAWIVKAIVESLHRGRYKIKSVDSILSSWQRYGKPSYNFSPEFEREILQDLPAVDDVVEDRDPPTLPQLDDLDPVSQFPRLSSQQLDPEESAPFPRHDRATPTPQPPTLRQGMGLPRTELDRPFLAELPSAASFSGKANVQPNQTSLHAKFQLFHTLRAIVTPHSQSSAEPDDLDPPISYSSDLG